MRSQGSLPTAPGAPARTYGIRRILLAVLSMIAALSLVPVHSAGADPAPPEADPFYAAPEDLSGYAAGAVIRSRPIAMFGLPLPVSARQLLYRSTDSYGAPIANVATVLVPNLSWFGGARPVLAYQVAENSIGSRCAPSHALHGGWPTGWNTLVDSPFMAAAMLRGWAVVVSDYEGPDSRFLDGVNSGRGVLDGVRAALASQHGGIGASSPVGAYGYSGGAYATLWAAELQPGYAPELRLAGIGAGGVPADWTAIADGVQGTTQAGLAVLIVHAITRNNPEAGLVDLLNDRGRAMLVEDAGACGEELIFKYGGARVDDFSAAPGLLWHPRFQAALRSQELGGRLPATSMYLYHSTSDNVIPVAGFTGLATRYCALGADLVGRHSPVPGHNPVAVAEVTGAFDHLADRFAGYPHAPGCLAR
ncbi:lipase family protein [Nocardia aurea]|uniref:Lipase family protein n=1 Tax=Nocardia aurea TaxID=2144174 RepID=A0ABV3FPJ3_9NOCA